MRKAALFRFLLPAAIGLLVGLFFILPFPLPDWFQEMDAWLNMPAFVLFWGFAFFGLHGLIGVDCMIVLEWLLVGLFVGTCWLYFGRTDGVRRHKRVARNIFAFAFATFVIVVISFVAYTQGTSVYLGFKHKNATYHAEFAEACDSLLALHPLGTNQSIEVPVTDPSLPKIITDLHPVRIGVSPNKVWILVNESHIDGLAVIWEPQNQTNTWALSINGGDDPGDIVFVTNRMR
jgi:hypothetical protein